MGLEYVELIMDLEDSFGIKLEDEDVADCRTVGDLFETLKNKVTIDTNPKTCLTQKTFYSVRKIFVEDFNVPEKSVVPCAEIKKLPFTNMRKLWLNLEQKLQVDLPKLELPSALVLFYFIMCLIASSITAAEFGFSRLSVLGSFIVWIIFFLTVVRWVSRPFAVVVPTECKTIGDLTRSITIRNFQKANETLSNKDIWNALTYFVAYASGEDEKNLTPETRFNEDLNFG